MQTTTTEHMNKGEIARKHNERNPEFIAHENAKNEHIDINNEYFEDSFSEALKRTDLREAYENVFGEALADYNAKQKRADKRMTIDDYMQSVVNDTRGKKQTKRVNGNKVIDENATNQGKRLSYEATYAVGNTRLDEYGERSQMLPRELQYRVVRKISETFEERNPHFVVVNNDIHGDEFFFDKDGVPVQSCIGSHIEFFPVASGFQRGLSVQNSMNKALKAMGFTSYAEWLANEKKYAEEILQEEYEKYCKENPEFFAEYGELEIIRPVSDSNRKGGMDKEQYAQLQEADQVINETLKIKRMFENSLESNKNKSDELDKREAVCDEREERLQAEERKLHEQQQKLTEEQLRLYKKADEIEQKEKSLLRRELDCDYREAHQKEDIDLQVKRHKKKLDNQYAEQYRKDREKDKKRITDYLESMSEIQKRLLSRNVKKAEEELVQRGVEFDYIEITKDFISDVEKKQ